MFEGVCKLIENSYEDHKTSLIEEHPRDFMDVFIRQIRAAKEVSSQPFHLFIF